MLGSSDQSISPNIDPRLYEEADNGPQVATDGTSSSSVRYDDDPNAGTHNVDNFSTAPSLSYTFPPLNNYPYPSPNHGFSGTATNYTQIHHNTDAAGFNGSGYGNAPPANNSDRLTSISDPPTQALQNSYNGNWHQKHRLNLDRRQARVNVRSEFELASSFQRRESRDTLGVPSYDTFSQSGHEGSHVGDEPDNDLSRSVKSCLNS